MQRRDRTRHLIELGGLVQKAGLADLAADDRATILGGLLGLSDLLQGEDRAGILEAWRRRGRRVFATNRTTVSTTNIPISTARLNQAAVPKPSE